MEPFKSSLELGCGQPCVCELSRYMLLAGCLLTCRLLLAICMSGGACSGKQQLPWNMQARWSR